MPSRYLAPMLLALFCTSIALAQPASPPATAPATTQASVKVDQTTPRGALKVLTVAISKGDIVAIRSVFSPANATETKLVDAVIGQQQAMMKFHDAAVTAFGADEAKKLPPGDVDAGVAQSLTALDQIPENVTGETATVGEGEQLIHMKKDGEKWILPVSLLAPQITPENVDRQLSQMSDQNKVLVDVADEIGKAKYKTADEAGKALQTRVMQQMMGHAATEPTTGPSAVPAPAAGPGGL